jgi:ribosomal subunit interface protein
VEIVITGRRLEVPERFRRVAEEKLAKIGQLAPRAHRVDVELSHERNPRQSQTSEKVEITVLGKGPVIRAEASTEDMFAALDLAFGKLLERLRRTRDRRKVHHGRQTPPSVRVPGSAEVAVAVARSVPDSVADLVGAAELTGPEDHAGAGDPSGNDAEYVDTAENSPVVIRTKDHSAVPMTLDQALYEMELVGHDFFLFVDAESRLPSVVYRRRGWNYGLIRLVVTGAEVAEPLPAVART